MGKYYNIVAVRRENGVVFNTVVVAVSTNKIHADMIADALNKDNTLCEYGVIENEPSDGRCCLCLRQTSCEK